MFDGFVRRRCHCSFVHSFASFMTRSTWSLSLFVVVVIAGLVAVVVAVVIVPLAAAIIYCRCCCCCPFVSSLFLVFVLCFRFFFPAVFALCFSCRFLAAVNCGNQRKDRLCCCACVFFFCSRCVRAFEGRVRSSPRVDRSAVRNRPSSGRRLLKKT